MARVIIVASIFLTVYSFLNIFFILKIPKIRKNGRFVFRLFSIIFATTPFIFIASSRNGHHLTSIVSGNIGYTWLAFVFLFLFAFPLSLIILKIAKKKRNFAFPASILIALFILLYGRYESQHIRAEFVKIETDKITEPKIRIVQISDIHFSPLTGRNFAEKVRDIVNSLSPDIVVSTGDLIDRGIRHPKEIAAILRTIEAPLGKYAVTGNHEFYYGMRESIRFTWASGFTLLRGRSIVKEGLTIAGVDDQSPFFEEKRPLHIVPGCYTVLLKHRPFPEDGVDGTIDLQLSGHTHGGQIFPFSLFVMIPYPRIRGMYTNGDGTKIYVNRGTGTWGPPIRFFSPPEITVIDLFNPSK